MCSNAYFHTSTRISTILRVHGGALVAGLVVTPMSSCHVCLAILSIIDKDY